MRQQYIRVIPRQRVSEDYEQEQLKARRDEREARDAYPEVAEIEDQADKVLDHIDAELLRSLGGVVLDTVE